MDRDKAEELWGKGTANANRMQANELGFEELANYLSKDPRGKKRWSQSKNIVIPVPDINDYKYSNTTINIIKHNIMASINKPRIKLLKDFSFPLVL